MPFRVYRTRRNHDSNNTVGTRARTPSPENSSGSTRSVKARASRGRSRSISSSSRRNHANSNNTNSRNRYNSTPSRCNTNSSTGGAASSVSPKRNTAVKHVKVKKATTAAAAPASPAMKRSRLPDRTSTAPAAFMNSGGLDVSPLSLPIAAVALPVANREHFRQPEIGGIKETVPVTTTRDAGVKYRFFGVRARNARYRKLLTYAINFFIVETHDFDPDIAASLKIDLVFINRLEQKTQCEGSCHYFAPVHGGFPTHFEIVLDPTHPVRKMLRTLAHEIEHVRQFSEGLLIIPEHELAEDGGYKNGEFCWRKSPDSPARIVNTRRVGCLNLPWETAACSKEARPTARLFKQIWFLEHEDGLDLPVMKENTRGSRASSAPGYSRRYKKKVLHPTAKSFGKPDSLERRVVTFHALSPDMCVGKDF